MIGLNGNRRYSGNIKAVVLDWAGTAVDFGCFGPLASLMDVFEKRGVAVTVEQARKPMGLMKKDHVRAMLQSEEISDHWFEVFGRGPTEGDVEEMCKELEPLMVATIAGYAEPAPGLLEAVEEFRRMGLKIGSTTGYSRPVMEALAAEAGKCGYRPDAVVTSSDVPLGRPSPFMIYRNALELAVAPMEAMVKIGDTVADIREGLSAGNWCIGVTRSSSDLGLSEREIEKLPPAELETRLLMIAERFYRAGAHYVVESMEHCPALIREINRRMAAGERP